MPKAILVSVLLFISPLLGKDFPSVKKGKAYGKRQLQSVEKVMDGIDSAIFLIPEEEREGFDSEKTRKILESQTIVETEIGQFLNDTHLLQNESDNISFTEDEDFFKQADAIVQNKENLIGIPAKEEETQEENRTCQQAGKPFVIEYERALVLEIDKEPKSYTQKIRKGHKKTKQFNWKSDAESYEKRKRKDLASDSSIQSFSVSLKKGGMLSKHGVKAKWSHYGDSKNCKNWKDKKIKNEAWSIKRESWEASDTKLKILSQSPQCVFLQRRCLDDKSKLIQGHQIDGKCWLEKVSFLCQYHDVKPCLFLKMKNCREIKRSCLDPTPYGCALWNTDFRCFPAKPNVSNLDDDNLMGLDEGEWDTAYQENEPFADGTLKLAAFDEIKQDLEKSEIADARRLQVFKGSKMQCSQSVADNLMCDCCHSFSGIAEKLDFAHCNAEEHSLSEMRAKGLCHYVGKRHEEFLRLWNSRIEHVYC